MKILKPGKVEQRKYTCPRCGCIFVATIKDVEERVYVRCPHDTCHYGGLEWNNGEPYEEPVLAAMETLRSFPTVDAVEVCFRKDCKHMEITPDNLRWCNAWGRFNGAGDDGYCNYGEAAEAALERMASDGDT